MKKIFYALAVLSLLLAFSACGGAGGNTETTNDASGEKTTESLEENTTAKAEEKTTEGAGESKTESENKETAEKAPEETSEVTGEETSEAVTEESSSGYTDLSSTSSPTIEDNNKNSVKVTSEKSNVTYNSSITFDGNADITISTIDITTASMHESVNCELCGIKETDHGMAYYICNEATNQGGFLIELKNPIPAGRFSGMTITFSASRIIRNGSQIRIIPSTTTSHSSFVNECPTMGDARKEMLTVDLGMTAGDIAALADSDGMIRQFKLYFRDKDNTDIYIKSIDFVTGDNIDYQSLCTIPFVEENCFYKGGALDMVAQKIAKNFSNIGLEAEIIIKATGYTQNTAKTAGKLSYTVTVTLEDGTRQTIKNCSTTIPTIKNAWLERADSVYGAFTNSNEQYKDRFDRAGLIYLENNTFSGTDTLKSVEYAVFSADKNITDASIRWFTPQMLNIDGSTFSLYVNAFLDYGSLNSGKDYRFAVRAVTENDNYVLHLDIPFTYEPLNAELEAVLNELPKMFWGYSYSFDNNENLSARVKEQIENRIKNETNAQNIVVNVEELMMGMSSATFGVKLTCVANLDTDRFPIRPSDDLYAYNGEYFSYNCFTRFNSVESPINLIYPQDGDPDLIIASEAIVNHMNAELSYLTSSTYPFVKAEICHPEAVTFEWGTKRDTAEYTLIISESADMSNSLTYTTSVVEDEVYASISVYNLKANTTYYWQVSSGGDVSNPACFTTADYPRFILTSDISNFRDIGGYLTVDGYRVKQGLAYRSAYLDPAIKNTDDIYTITQLLGIKTDLDLRGGSGYSPLGKDINIIRSSVQWYTGVFAKDQYEAFRFAIAQFANKDNYPMVYHCQIGRDRTGTVTTTILALLGVDEEMLIREYMLSFNSVSGNGDNVPGYQMVGNIKSFINGLKNYGPADATLAEHAEAFLLEVGVTPAEIQAIKDILLEK